jgi:hypothetical protein
MSYKNKKTNTDSSEGKLKPASVQSLLLAGRELSPMTDKDKSKVSAAIQRVKSRGRA